MLYRIARLALSVLLGAMPFVALAQDRPDGRCSPPVSVLKPLLLPATLQSNQVGLRFIGHATFLIESPGGVTIATDYNDYVRPDRVPMIATMNRAHSTHYTLTPDPGIAHVLRGWSDSEEPADHDLSVLDVRVRNIATNIRDFSGAGTRYYGNSIFVFEVGSLCLAHLGHLHHPLSPEQRRKLGHIDVLMVPVDGSWTLNVEGMAEVVRAIAPRAIFPMHYFSEQSLQRFLRLVEQDYPIERFAEPSVILSPETLPKRPTVIVLPGR